ERFIERGEPEAAPTLSRRQRYQYGVSGGRRGAKKPGRFSSERARYHRGNAPGRSNRAREKIAGADPQTICLANGSVVGGEQDSLQPEIALYRLRYPGNHRYDFTIVFALFPRTWPAYLRLFQDPDASDSIFRLLFAASFCLVRRIRPARTVAKGNPIPFGSFPADTFLPRFPAGKYVSRRSRILPGRSHRAIRRRARDLHWRRIFTATDRRVAPARATDRSNGNDSDLSN